MSLFKNKKAVLVFISILLASLWLTACGGNADHSKQDSNVKQEAGNQNNETKTNNQVATERELTDATGNTVKIPANPERIIASYLEDHLVALGVKPIVQWSVKNGVQNYLQNDLKDIPAISYDLPYEEVTGHNPDLIILGESGTGQDGKYEQYSKIAPTFLLGDEISKDWRKALAKVGEVLGKEAEAQKVLEEYDAKAKAAKESLQAAIGDKSVVAIWLISGKFFVVSENQSSGGVLYQDLGMKAPEIVKEISSTGTANWNAISEEKLALLDADYIFLIDSDAQTGSEALKAPIWQGLKAVKANQVFTFDRNHSWLYSGAIANGQMIDDLLTSLVK